jgi:3,5-epimerase/4-reductase
MKILVFGYKGWIGSQITEYLNKQQIPYITGKCRVEKENELVKELNNVNPTHIICCIARTHNTNLENKSASEYLQDPNTLYDNLRDNFFSPILLAKICNERNIHLTYIGTGCIYNYDEKHEYGNENTGYKEIDKPNFFGSNYSTVKGFTDQYMNLFSNVLNLRMRMCLNYDKNNSKNFINKFVSFEKICSVPNSFTVLPDMLPILIDMVSKNVKGTFNFTNAGLISHNEILEMYKEIVDPNFTWKNMSLSEQKQMLNSDRANNYLDISKLQKLYPNLINIKLAVRNCLENYK